jgi:hypothetical protein
MPDHDNSYKFLFSHQEIVRDLLVGFVQEPWLAEIDFSTLEKVNGSYVSDDLRSREDDVIWRVRFKDRWPLARRLSEGFEGLCATFWTTSHTCDIFFKNTVHP